MAIIGQQNKCKKTVDKLNRIADKSISALGVIKMLWIAALPAFVAFIAYMGKGVAVNELEYAVVGGGKVY